MMTESVTKEHTYNDGKCEGRNFLVILLCVYPSLVCCQVCAGERQHAQDGRPRGDKVTQRGLGYQCFYHEDITTIRNRKARDRIRSIYTPQFKASFCFRTVVSYFKEVRIGQIMMESGVIYLQTHFTRTTMYSESRPTPSSYQFTVFLFQLLVQLRIFCILKLIIDHQENNFFFHLPSLWQPVGNVRCPLQTGDEDRQVCILISLAICIKLIITICRNIFIFNLALSDFLLVIMSHRKSIIYFSLGRVHPLHVV